MFLGLSDLSRFLTYFTAFFGAFLAALWVSLVLWTWRDIRKRSEDRLVHILAALSVAILNIPGLIIYLILRPGETMEEMYLRTLEEEALLSQIEERTLCPGCSSQVDADWVVCPHCHTRLRKTCGNCAALLELPWQVCPFCGSPSPSANRDEGVTVSSP